MAIECISDRWSSTVARGMTSRGSVSGMPASYQRRTAARKSSASHTLMSHGPIVRYANHSSFPCWWRTASVLVSYSVPSLAPSARPTAIHLPAAAGPSADV